MTPKGTAWFAVGLRTMHKKFRKYPKTKIVISFFDNSLNIFFSSRIKINYVNSVHLGFVAFLWVHGLMAQCRMRIPRPRFNFQRVPDSVC